MLIKIFRKAFSIIDGMIIRTARRLEAFHEKIHGIDFVITESMPEEGHSSYEQSSLYSRRLIRKYLEGKITKSDAIIDVGCGKGKMLYFFSKLPFGKVRGLEYSQEIVQTARSNIRRLCARKAVEIIQGDAVTYQDYDEFNYVYLFNPFKEIIMKPFLANLKASVRRNPRTIHIIYNNPVCHDLFIKEGVSFIRDLSLPVYHPRLYIYVLKPGITPEVS